MNHDVVRLAPKVWLVTLMLFLAAALLGGEVLGFYDRFWWWDDFLHTASGVILAFSGFILVHFLDRRYSLRTNPLFIAIFAFMFAITVGVLWEIFEFSMDVLFGWHMQQWNLPEDSRLIGRDYQGMGLRDTMSDLIGTWIGAMIASTVLYFAYKHERQTMIGIMSRSRALLRRNK